VYVKILVGSFCPAAVCVCVCVCVCVGSTSAIGLSIHPPSHTTSAQAQERDMESYIFTHAHTHTYYVYTYTHAHEHTVGVLTHTNTHCRAGPYSPREAQGRARASWRRLSSAPPFQGLVRFLLGLDIGTRARWRFYLSIYLNVISIYLSI
jgi:hypothetical protein